MVKKKLHIPVRSSNCPDGSDDEGISSVLGKPKHFRYSRKFLDEWYKDGGN